MIKVNPDTMGVDLSEYNHEVYGVRELTVKISPNGKVGSIELRRYIEASCLHWKDDNFTDIWKEELK